MSKKTEMNGGKRGEEKKINNLTQEHSHGTLRKGVRLIPSKLEESSINLFCPLPPSLAAVAIVASIVDHFGNM